MNKWMDRENRLRQKHVHRNFSKPFKKLLEKDQKKKERQKIREAQRAKYTSFDEDDDQVDE